MVDAVFKTLKSKLMWPAALRSCPQAETAVAAFVDGFYNPVRRHSSLDSQSPHRLRTKGNGR
ncbi:hypothetical protein PARPLA_02764 [Rhodobacteraceae bacterium THAF1]|nr:hypothetical protein FIU81_05730 [Palleronia sp. THAF1]VDC28720.1 hypothetical protein PARPLA_02764 [Rhodobacteraceae bacterium THAF1]